MLHDDDSYGFFKDKDFLILIKGLAIFRKIRHSKFKEKVKIILKIILNLFGLKKPLYIAPYREDLKIYEMLKDISIKKRVELQCCEDFETKELNNIEKKITNAMLDRIPPKMTLTCGDEYIALMVESLDRGGLEKVVAILARKLRERSISIKIFCCKACGETATQLKSEGFEIINFSGNRAHFKKYIENYRPCLVNTHFVKSFLDILYYKEIPIIETIHNMYLFMDSKRIALEQKKDMYISSYIAVSNAVKETFISKICKNSTNKIAVVGNAVEVSEKKLNNKNVMREKLDIPENAVVFICVGSIDPRKNQIGIIRAFDIFCSLVPKDPYLIFLGNIIDKEYANRVEKLLESKKIRKNIKLMPFSNDVYSYLNASDVFVLNSYYEGWSIAATEALYCGLPIIHSKCGSGEELTKDGVNGILINNPCNKLNELLVYDLIDYMSAGINDNIEELVCAFCKVYWSIESWRAKKENIKLEAFNEFNIEVMINQYLEIYEKETTNRK